MNRFCAACGKPTNPDTRFCVHCGVAVLPAVPAHVERVPATTPQPAAAGVQPDMAVLATVQPKRDGRKAWAILATGATAIVVLAWMYVSPYLALHNLKEIASTGDADALEKAVDFPAFRASLKRELGKQLSLRAVKDLKEDGPFAALGSALAGGLVELMIDRFVTPQVVADVAQGKKVDSAPDVLDRVIDRFTAESGDNRDQSEMHVSSGYESLGRFAVHVYPPKSKVAVTVVFLRSGLATWRLSGVRLPDLDELTKNTEEATTLPQHPTPTAATSAEYQRPSEATSPEAAPAPAAQEQASTPSGQSTPSDRQRYQGYDSLDSCVSEGTSGEAILCVSDEVEREDAWLNREYKRVMARYKAEGQEDKAAELRKAELAWIKWVTAKCDSTPYDPDASTKLVSLWSHECRLDMTRTRANELSKLPY